MDLSRLLINDNVQRRLAEAEFARLQAQPLDLLKFLFHSISTNRQSLHHSLHAMTGVTDAVASITMGCVLLRGMAVREKHLFSSLSEHEFYECRSHLLEALRDESVPIFVRRTLCNTIAATAGIHFNWPELTGYIQDQLSTNTSVNSVQLCLFLLNKLAEYVGPFLVANIDHVLFWISSYMMETSPINGFTVQNSISTRLASSLALMSLTHEIPQAFIDNVTVPLEYALAVLRHLIQLGESTSEFLSDLQLLVDSRPSVLRTVWQPVFDTMAYICNLPLSDVSVDEDTRSAALKVACAMLTNPTSAGYCSHPETRAIFVEICVNFIGAIDPDSDPAFFHQQDVDGKTFGDSTDDDNSQDQLSLRGAQCLDNLCNVILAEEIVQCCVSKAWGLVSNQNDWRARRTGLFVASIVCEHACDAIYPILPQIVPQILHFISNDPHPRVRYSAIHCICEMIQSFPGDDENEDEDEDEDYDDDDDESGNDQAKSGGPRSSFRELFLGSVPIVACQALQRDLALPRIAALCVRLLTSFFDPDCIDGEFEVLPQIMDFCVAYIATPVSAQGFPHELFVKQEMLMLLGNISFSMPAEALHARYDTLSSLYKQIISPVASPAHLRDQATLDASRLQCKAIEAFALTGKAVGKERFYADSIALLHLFVQALPQLESSDDRSFYVMQSAARIAGIIGDDFLAFVPHLLPGLISRLSEPIEIDVTAEDDASALKSDDPKTVKLSSSSSSSAAATTATTTTTTATINYPTSASTAGGGSNDTEVTTTTIYQRGMGSVILSCNSSQITDKKMSGRILYEYLLEIPNLVTDYIPDIVRALVPLVEKRYVFTQECAEVLSDCLSEALVVHLKYCNPPELNHAGTLSMVEYILGSLCASLDRQQQINRMRSRSTEAAAAATAAALAANGGTNGGTMLSAFPDSRDNLELRPTLSTLSRICAACSCMRECFNSISTYQPKWNLLVSAYVIKACLLLLRDEMLQWIERKVNYSELEPGMQDSDEVILEEHLRAHVSDALCYAMMVRDDAEGAEQVRLFHEAEVAIYLNREPYASLFVTEIEEG